MNIILKNIGKRFNKEWIFRNIDFEFETGNNPASASKYAILGSNGSGKSTLLQIIAGNISATEGEIKWQMADGRWQMDEFLFKNIAFASPYLELPEEMTWREAVKFHGKFKKYTLFLKREDVISISGLSISANKEIRNFSSGMKQRAKLALAILSHTPLLLLDEPCSNLDENAVKWYQNLIAEYAKEKLVIVCSNYNKKEYSFCDKELLMSR